MLSYLFNRQKQTTRSHISEIKDRLDLYQKAKPETNIHLQVLMALKRYNSVGLQKIGRGFAYYTDPERQVRSEANMPNSEEHFVKSSANLSFTEEILDDGKKSFAMTINQDSQSYADLRNRMIFGLYGTYERDGAMEIETIYAPDLDEHGNFTGMIKIPLSEEHLELALVYAGHCIESIHSDENPNAVQCLQRAMDQRHLKSSLDETHEP